MKQKIHHCIDEMKEEIIQLGDDLFKLPELGFKEFKSKQRIIEELAKYDIHVEKEYFETGFEVSIGNGNGPIIGLIAELDAIVTKGHPFADIDTSAAHSCGHSVQSTIMCATLIALKKSGALDGLYGKIKLFFTPAEEFCDMEYRQGLIDEGKILYPSGKQNMIEAGCFDDCDCVLSVHIMGESDFVYSINSTLAGFVFKRITFLGKAAHAAVIPHLGVNALNEFALFQSAVGMLRETFKDEDMVRIHGILVEGGESVNSIPSHVVYECYVRSMNPDTITSLSKQIETTAYHCAHALNGDVEIETVPGYYPLHQCKDVNKIILDNILDFVGIEKIHNNELSMAAGDIGDISLFKPTIQLGVGGVIGRVHGDSLEIADKNRLYIESSKIMASAVYDLLVNPEYLQNISSSYKPLMNKEEYISSITRKAHN